MDKNLFNDLVTSLEEAVEIKKGLLNPSRKFNLANYTNFNDIWNDNNLLTDEDRKRIQTQVDKIKID